MDMRGAAGIGDGADGAEGVGAVVAGDDMAEALEGVVIAAPAPVAIVEVNAVGVALPDLDAGARQGGARGVQNPALEDHDLTPRIADRAGDADKVVVDIGEAHPLRRIKRPLSRGGRAGAGAAGEGEERGGQEGGEEGASGEGHGAAPSVTGLLRGRIAQPSVGALTRAGRAAGRGLARLPQSSAVYGATPCAVSGGW